MKELGFYETHELTYGNGFTRTYKRYIDPSHIKGERNVSYRNDQKHNTACKLRSRQLKQIFSINWSFTYTLTAGKAVASKSYRKMLRELLDGPTANTILKGIALDELIDYNNNPRLLPLIKGFMKAQAEMYELDCCGFFEKNKNDSHFHCHGLANFPIDLELWCRISGGKKSYQKQEEVVDIEELYGWFNYSRKGYDEMRSYMNSESIIKSKPFFCTHYEVPFQKDAKALHTVTIEKKHSSSLDKKKNNELLFRKYVKHRHNDQNNEAKDNNHTLLLDFDSFINETSKSIICDKNDYKKVHIVILPIIKSGKKISVIKKQSKTAAVNENNVFTHHIRGQSNLFHHSTLLMNEQFRRNSTKPKGCLRQ